MFQKRLGLHPLLSILRSYLGTKPLVDRDRGTAHEQTWNWDWWRGLATAYLQHTIEFVDVWLSILHRDVAQVEVGELRGHVVHLGGRERETLT